MRNTERDQEDIRDIYRTPDAAEKHRQAADRAIPKLIGSVGAIAFTLGLIIMAVADKVNIFTLGLTAVGLLLLVVFVAIDFSSVRKFLTSRSTVYSTNLSIVILALFGILIVVNAFASNHYFAVDLTKNRDNSLSDQTMTILEGINKSKRKIELTAFMRSDDPRRISLKMLLDRYSHITPSVAFSFVDYEIRKKLAIEKGIQQTSILIESEGTSQTVYEFDERSITAGILKMLHPNQTVIGMLAGHGELGADGTGGRSVSKFIEQLEKENYIVKPIDMATSGGVPLEVSMVLVVGPSKSFNEKDIQALREFAERGGSFAVFVEPFSNHGLTQLFDMIGIEDTQDMVIDPKENYFQDETVPVVKTYAMHPITQGFLASQAAEGGFVGGLIMPTSTSLKIKEMVPADVKTEPLAITSSDSWGETSADKNEFTPDEDIQGPVTVAVTGTKTFKGSEESNSIISRFAVVGDADLLTDASIGEGSNFNFAMNTVNWLNAEENMMDERPKIADAWTISLEASQSKVIQIFTLLLPLSIAGLGIFMWVKRK
jgi:ABC-type uncharacterized transport system involved in gliding motility auxiliary subunit